MFKPGQNEMKEREIDRNQILLIFVRVRSWVTVDLVALGEAEILSHAVGM